MKTLFTILTAISLSIPAFAQKNYSGSYEELMRASRRARTTGIILVSTGPVVSAVGIGVLIDGLIKNEEGTSNYYYDTNGNYVQGSPKKYTSQIIIGAAASLVGIAAAISSIAFTNKAYDLRREARKVKLNATSERITIPGFQNSPGNAQITQGKLSLIIPIGK